MTGSHKIVLLLFILLFIAAIGGGFFLYQTYILKPKISPQNTQQPPPPVEKGRIVLGITDAVGTVMGKVTSVVLYIDKAEVHNVTSGWVLTSNAHRNFDLLELKQSATISLLSNSQVTVGDYDQVRLTISKVVVTENNIQKEAKLPSGQLEIPLTTQVNANKTSAAVIDFLTDKSLHKTASGTIIFIPVLKLMQTINTDVQTQLYNKIVITGGVSELDKNFGVDESGQIKDNFELKGDLDIDSTGKIVIKGPPR